MSPFPLFVLLSSFIFHSLCYPLLCEDTCIVVCPDGLIVSFFSFARPLRIFHVSSVICCSAASFAEVLSMILGLFVRTIDSCVIPVGVGPHGRFLGVSIHHPCKNRCRPRQVLTRTSGRDGHRQYHRGAFTVAMITRVLQLPLLCRGMPLPKMMLGYDHPRIEPRPSEALLPTYS